LLTDLGGLLGLQGLMLLLHGLLLLHLLPDAACVVRLGDVLAPVVLLHKCQGLSGMLEADSSS
jgi:hypothetical protein